MTAAGVRAGLGHSGAIVVRNLLVVVGLTTFAGLSWQIGLERIIAHLQPLGWRFVLVFLPYLLVFVCDTVGWRYAFERRPPVHFIRLLAIHVIGKAANIITPLVPVGGEPIKAYLLQVGGIPFTEGLASAVISRTVATIAHGLFVLAMTCHLLGWLVEGVEVYVLLMLLHLPPSPTMALGVVALSSAVRAASFMVPGSLGIQEGGNVFIFGSFGLPPDAAMAFSLLRRIREWGWAAAGLLLVRRLSPEQRLSLAAARAGGR